ncbi:MAG: hypothetical protein HY074_11620, partial [Deltaproteobacteria bacterium]|nr:hypothetical protein [Deltaproteobacteria bacterium]
MLMLFLTHCLQLVAFAATPNLDLVRTIDAFEASGFSCSLAAYSSGAKSMQCRG